MPGKVKFIVKDIKDVFIINMAGLHRYYEISKWLMIEGKLNTFTEALI